MSKIKIITAREILDSRGNPTLEVDILLKDGSFGRAAVPSGASTGIHEAVELRDHNSLRYGGKGTLTAVGNVNDKIAKMVRNKDFNQKKLDQMLIQFDGTENKGRLGANAILGVSLAFAKATAASRNRKLYSYFRQISSTKQMSLPMPMMNIINGGRHAEHSTDIQEFMIMPIGAKNFKEALRMGAEIFHTLKKILHSRNLNTSIGDEGGYAPSLPSNESALQIILEAITASSYIPGRDIALAIDSAASEFYKNGFYHLASEKKTFTNAQLIELYASWIKKYPIVSIEDGLAEDDWEGYTLFNKVLGKKIQIVGDDLYATNKARLERGIKEKSTNSILIKLNQIGTVTETIETVTTARNAGLTAIISHRSGETEDTTIADFAVGLGVGQIKTGSLCRGERTAKYNQLLRIEEEMGQKIKLARFTKR